MPKFVVIGNPLEHSLSPAIHQLFAAQLGHQVAYEKLPLKLDQFEQGVEAFFADGGAGANVTLPFKEQACAWVHELDPLAAEARAVNTIVRNTNSSGQDRYVGYNTDGLGLVEDLQQHLGWTIAGKKVVLLGAGGAARGVIAPLLACGPSSLVIANRTTSKAEQLASVFESALLTHATFSELGAELGVQAGDESSIDLLINATSLGVQGNATDFANLFPAASAKQVSPATGAHCYDLMYAAHSQGTAFCQWAQTQECAGQADGLGMLVCQAALAYELWQGERPDERAALKQLVTDLGLGAHWRGAIG